MTFLTSTPSASAKVDLLRVKINTCPYLLDHPLLSAEASDRVQLLMSDYLEGYRTLRRRTVGQWTVRLRTVWRRTVGQKFPKRVDGTAVSHETHNTDSMAGWGGTRQRFNDE